MRKYVLMAAACAMIASCNEPPKPEAPLSPTEPRLAVLDLRDSRYAVINGMSFAIMPAVDPRDRGKQHEKLEGIFPACAMEVGPFLPENKSKTLEVVDCVNKKLNKSMMLTE